VLISHKYKAIFIHIQRTGGNSIQQVFTQYDPDVVESVGIDPSKQRTKHCFASDIQAAVDRRLFDSYTKFSVVRNPFARMVSWYSMFRRGWGTVQLGARRHGRLMQAYYGGLERFNHTGTPRNVYMKLWGAFFSVANRVTRGNFAPNSPQELALRHIDIGARVMDAVNRNARTFAQFVALPQDYPGGLFERFYVNQLDYISAPGTDTLLVDRVLTFENLSHDFAALADQLGFPGRLPHINRSDHEGHYRGYYDSTTREVIARRFHRDCDRFDYEF